MNRNTGLKKIYNDEEKNKLETETDYLLTEPIVTVDYELYKHYLEDTDLDEQQKREILEALWSIITSFVSLGFGVHPLQEIAQLQCGQNDENNNHPPSKNPNDVDYDEHKNHEEETVNTANKCDV